MKRKIATLLIAASAAIPCLAEDFFSTGDPDQLFNLSARIGLNTSNRTVSNSVANIWNRNAWGLGFDAGVVADINIKDFISLQPGLFYESRSGSFAYQGSAYTPGGEHFVKTQLGKGRDYLFTIPILASFHFNVSDEVRWNVEAGPYFQIKLRSTFDDSFTYPRATATGAIEYFGDVKTAGGDVGLKIGTGLDIFKDYYIGAHYMAGFCHVWNPGSLGGHNKAWVFTIGYRFL